MRLFRRRDPVLDEEVPAGPNACRAPGCQDGYVEVADLRTGLPTWDICRVCHGTGTREQDSKTAPGRK